MSCVKKLPFCKLFCRHTVLSSPACPLSLHCPGNPAVRTTLVLDKSTYFVALSWQLKIDWYALSCKESRFVRLQFLLISASFNEQKYNITYNQGWRSGFGKISDRGLCTPNDRRYLKYYWTKILDIFASLFCLFSYICFHTFGVRRSL